MDINQTFPAWAQAAIAILTLLFTSKELWKLLWKIAPEFMASYFKSSAERTKYEQQQSQLLLEQILKQNELNATRQHELLVSALKEQQRLLLDIQVTLTTYNSDIKLEITTTRNRIDRAINGTELAIYNATDYIARMYSYLKGQNGVLSQRVKNEVETPIKRARRLNDDTVELRGSRGRQDSSNIVTSALNAIDGSNL